MGLQLRQERCDSLAQCAEDTKQERSGIGGIFPETELNGRGRVQMRHPLRPTMNLQILPVQLMIFPGMV